MPNTRQKLQSQIDRINPRAKELLNKEFTLDYHSAGYRIESIERDYAYGPRGNPKDIENFLEGIRTALDLLEIENRWKHLEELDRQTRYQE